MGTKRQRTSLSVNFSKKYRKIQEQFTERSNKRYEGKRVRVEDVVEELSEEWCLSQERIWRIIGMKLKKSA